MRNTYHRAIDLRHAFATAAALIRHAHNDAVMPREPRAMLMLLALFITPMLR